MASKVLILLPDGVGLRNFVFTQFPEFFKHHNLELKFWNATDYDLAQHALKSIELKGNAHFKTDLYKRARKEIEIKTFVKNFDNDIFNQYLFKTRPSGFKSLTKHIWLKLIIHKYKNSLHRLREKIVSQERQTSYYKNCMIHLQSEQPKMIFCTNQRPAQAIAPILAAQDLGVPTATFIFSWDNLPKATMVIETDYYFVWSDFMAKQLLEYYPYIEGKQIIVTGSPQFELHSNPKYNISKTEFCKKFNLPKDKKYICFSGDDITTSPHDPDYLNDVCEAIKLLNSKGFNFAVIFRPCPVDFSDRYDKVLEKHKKLVYCLRPKWKPQGLGWNSVMPTPEDQALLYNTIAHSELIINLGSSMVFDAACHGKACVFINYNPDVNELKKDVKLVYKYIHFQSMPSKDAVIWLNSKAEIAEKLLEGLQNPFPYIEQAKKWFSIICKQPENSASERIVNALKSCL